MNTVITSSPPSPFNSSGHDFLYPQFGSAHINSSTTSLGTIRWDRVRAVSSGSRASAASVPTPRSGSRQENDRPRRAFLAETLEGDSAQVLKHSHAHASGKISRKSSWGTDIPPPSVPKGIERLREDVGELQDVDLNTDDAPIEIQVRKTIPGPLDAEALEREDLSPTTKCDSTDGIHNGRHAFHKFVTNLRRKSLHRGRTLPSRHEDESDSSGSLKNEIHRMPRHQKSSSVSSLGFVTAVKTASISIASHSFFTRPRKYDVSSQLRSGTRNSRLSQGDNRDSSDSRHTTKFPLQNQGVWERAVKRRNTIEEIITTEESYISDLKVLVNAYFTLLACLPTLSQQTRGSIRKNVEDIIQLHEKLLSELAALVPLRLVPPQDIEHLHPRIRLRSPTRSRSHSLDIEPTGFDRSMGQKPARKSADIARSNAEHSSNMCAEPETAAEIAKVFDRMMSRFFAYEEYGAKYQLMVQDSASASTSIPSWRNYEKGIEALANSLVSSNNRGSQAKKGLQLGDLLIKPIQRICKYPLLFEDLLRETPVYDCPESHAELEKVLYRLRETVREINKATDDPTTRTRVEQTWLLQDRLEFPADTDHMQDQLLRSTMRHKWIAQPRFSHANEIRMLGHVLLCGVLYVAWQGVDYVQGQYLICILFKSILLLATPNKNSKYSILAGLTLGDASMESVSGGRGLQSADTLFSWKIVFEMENRLFEMLFCACSPKEEEEWMNRLQLRCAAETMNYTSIANRKTGLLPVLALDIKPTANVFGQPGTLARRISTQSSRIISPCAQVAYVVIRNTHAIRESPDSATITSPVLNRSQSLLSTDRTTILTPRRSDRMRLESQLADVWTRAILPYPGMSARRGEHLIRASASSVMRKLSIASITRRTPSLASMSHNVKPDEDGKLEEEFGRKDSMDSPNTRGFGYGSLKRKGDKVISGLYQMPIEPPTRNSSVRGIRRSKSFGVVHSRKVSKGKGRPITSVSDNDQLPIQPEFAKKRWSSPANMVKGWSSDGFRRFFP